MLDDSQVVEASFGAKMNRNRTIDIAKGIGIILVVAGHISGVAGDAGPSWIWLKSFLYQFHIPLFFFLSGLFFKPDEQWGSFLIKKIKRLYVPYVVANLIFLVVDVILRKISGIDIIVDDDLKHAVKIVLGIGLAPLGGATWFLIALFRSVILYKIVNALCRGRQAVVSLICISIGIVGLFATSKFAISSTMVAVAFYWLGVFRKSAVFRLDKISPIWKIVVALLSLVVLIVLRPHNAMDVSSAFYDNRLFAVVGSCLGIIFVLTSSELLKKMTKLSRLFCYVGKNTMPVLIGHFAAFKAVVIIQVMMMGASTRFILSHPCYDVSGAWAILYFSVGLLAPLVVSSMIRVRAK